MENEYCSLSTIPLTAPPISSQGNLDRWFAVVIRPSQARVASMALQGLGYEQFQPMRAVRRQWSDRVKVIQKPLFPGYLFCRFDPQNRLPVLTAAGVISIVKAGDKLLPVDAGEIATIRALLNSGAPVYPHPYLEVGQRVRIEGGAFAGVEGLLTAVRNEHRVIASITILQRSVYVQIDPARLRRL